MFIWEDEPKDKTRMQVITGPTGNKVRFRKYANKLFVHVIDFLENNPDKVEMLININKCIDKKWQADLTKLWMDIDLFEKIEESLKLQKEEINETGWIQWLQNKKIMK